MGHTILLEDGRTTEVVGSISLKEAQQIVGGYVEVVRAIGGFLLVDEEARLKGNQKIVNDKASKLAGREILGHVVFIDSMKALK